MRGESRDNFPQDSWSPTVDHDVLDSFDWDQTLQKNDGFSESYTTGVTLEEQQPRQQEQTGGGNRMIVLSSCCIRTTNKHS